MADLRELHATLEALQQAGKTAKVSFYYLGEGDLKMYSGSIAVANGTECYIQYQQLSPAEALQQIPRLHFAKVTSLPSMVVEQGGEAVPMVQVLDALDPSRQAAPAPAPVPVAMAAPAPDPAVEAASAPAAVEAPQKHSFYSHIALQKDALELLEPLFGVGAGKKVEEFARQSPPLQHPAEFLARCRQHAAMMLGAKKAEELFQPIFDKLSH